MENNQSQTEEKGISKEEYQLLQEEFEARQKEIEERLWMDSSVSRFDNLLRQHYTQTLEEFSRIILQDICENSNAFLGVFYHYDKETKICKAIAGYACKIDKIKQKEYLEGEGIIGQAILSKKALYFDDLPAGSFDFNIVSVKVSIANMLVQPLVHNEEAVGVLEILFLKPLEDNIFRFLQIISKNIASMLESIHNNILTQKLLQETQENAEALRAQEEEMRQNMEELSATQEEMFTKQNLLDEEMTALNNSSVIRMELSPVGYIRKANKAFYDLFGFTPAEIEDQLHSKLVSPEYARSAEYQEFWENMRKGKSFSGEQKRLTKDGREVWLQATYSPIIGKKGKIKGVLKFGFDITQLKELIKNTEEKNAMMKTQEEILMSSMEKTLAKQEELETQKEKIMKLMDFFPMGLITLKENLAINFCNQTALAILQTTIQEAFDQPITHFFRFIKPEHLQSNKKLTQKIIRRDTSALMAEIHVVVLEDDEDKILLFFRDISQELRKEQELVVMLEQLEQYKELSKQNNSNTN